MGLLNPWVGGACPKAAEGPTSISMGRCFCMGSASFFKVMTPDLLMLGCGLVGHVPVIHPVALWRRISCWVKLSLHSQGGIL